MFSTRVRLSGMLALEHPTIRAETGRTHGR